VFRNVSDYENGSQFTIGGRVCPVLSPEISAPDPATKATGIVAVRMSSEILRRIARIGRIGPAVRRTSLRKLIWEPNEDLDAGAEAGSTGLFMGNNIADQP
jgi:hypothetical protein